MLNFKSIIKDFLFVRNSGSGDLYVVGIIGAIMAGSYFMTGGLTPQLEKNPINPQYVEIDQTNISANKDSLQLVNLMPKSSPTPTVSTLPTPTLTVDQCKDKSAVAIVVDTSGSMGVVDPGATRSRLSRLKDALKIFVDNFSLNSAISLVKFDGTGEVVVPFGKLSDNKTTLFSSIDGMQSGGSTNMKNGLADARAEIERVRSAYPDYNFYTVFMTDGVPESGNCKYRQYSGSDGYEEGPYDYFDQGEPPPVPPFCYIEGTTTKPTFYTHKWSPVDPSNQLKQDNVKIFSIAMFQPSSDVYDTDTNNKAEDLMKSVASDPDSRYYVSSPTTRSLIDTYQEISSKICN